MATIKEPIENYGLSSKDRKRKMFSKIGVVGCGKEGQNIVGITASAGLEVVFVELSQEKIDLAIDHIGRNLDTKIDNWGLTSSEKKAIMGRIRGTLNYDDLRDCDFVIECIRYDETGERSTNMRKDIFKTLERVVASDAIIATNASTIIISELAADLEYKERCISLHFLVTQPEAKVIEVVKGLYTSDEVFEKVWLFASMIKYIAFSVTETPGLVSLRLFATTLNEACQMLMENVASKEDIDRILQMGFGYRLGVFRMADVIGIEKVVSLMENMYYEYGDKKYKPSPVLKRLFHAKQLGVRSGKGFYNYDEDGALIKETPSI